jgi:hypothetical protein
MENEVTVLIQSSENSSNLALNVPETVIRVAENLAHSIHRSLVRFVAQGEY